MVVLILFLDYQIIWTSLIWVISLCHTCSQDQICMAFLSYTFQGRQGLLMIYQCEDHFLIFKIIVITQSTCALFLWCFQTNQHVRTDSFFLLVWQTCSSYYEINYKTLQWVLRFENICSKARFYEGKSKNIWLSFPRKQ